MSMTGKPQEGTESNSPEKLWDLIRHIKFAMFTKLALWSKMTEAWFSGGVDDPDLALVEVEITHAHYWDVKENKMTQLWKMAQAAMTGNPPSDMGETGEVRMH